MKKERFITNITDYIFANRIKFLFTLISLVVGTVIGSLSAIFIDTSGFDSLGLYIRNFASSHTLQTLNKGSVFGMSLYANIKCVLLVWCSGFWKGLIPLGLIQLFSKGYKLGFTTVFIVRMYSGKGILFMFVSIFPQMFILIPALLVYTVFNMNFSVKLAVIRSRGQMLHERKDLLLQNFLSLVICVFIIILSSLIDTYVVPTVLKPICAYMN